MITCRALGARLTLPRDLQVSYFIGRLGVVKISDAWPVFWGSQHTARTGFGRLVRLRILRSFPRAAVSLPRWFALTSEGLAWVVAETGCDESELRAPSGIARLNLPALSQRNRLWVSLIVASRAHPTVRLRLFRPEVELRRAAEVGVPVVPDSLFVLDRQRPTEQDPGQQRDQPGALSSHAFMVELDAGSERSGVWRAKAGSYRKLHAAGALYGEPTWSVLALVPSARRAATVASAITEGGAGSFSLVGVITALEAGGAFARVLGRASELVGAGPVQPWSLVDLVLPSTGPAAPLPDAAFLCRGAR